MRSWTPPHSFHANTAYRSVCVHAKTVVPPRSVTCSITPAVVPPPAPYRTMSTAETVPSVPQGHPIVNSQPDESTSVASLTAANLEIPAPVTHLVVGIDMNVVARLTRFAATMLSRILASTLRQLLKSERPPLAADDVNCSCDFVTGASNIMCGVMCFAVFLPISFLIATCNFTDI